MLKLVIKYFSLTLVINQAHIIKYKWEGNYLKMEIVDKNTVNLYFDYIQKKYFENVIFKSDILIEAKAGNVFVESITKI